MNNSIISIENLFFDINDRVILDNINISFDRGELIGIIGPNGAGKTTLLKCLNLINDFKGVIKIEGRSTRDYKNLELAMKIALLNQNTEITFPFPCEDIVLMGRYPYIQKGKSLTKEDYFIANKCMELTDTLHLSKSKITNISGGERQRVLLAKTLAQQTDILLLDEPSSSLDIKYEEKIFKLLKKLTDQGKTIITTIHDLRIAIKYCDTIALLKKGEIFAYGNMENIMTSLNLSEVYEVDIEVYSNKLANLLDYYIK